MIKLILPLLLFIPSILFATEYRVMSYNVENLFDTTHDEGKNDYAYLPKNHVLKKECKKISYDRYRKECERTDWNEKALENKLVQLKKVIQSQGSIDFLGLSEVENENVAQMLAKKIGFSDVYVSNSLDKRGIDLALLVKSSKHYKFLESKQHLVDNEYLAKNPTRYIFEVSFLFGEKQKIFFFLNHWPSLSNPTSTRISAAQVLKDRVINIQKSDKNALIIALGDFNTIDENHPHPFKDILLKETQLIDLHEKMSKSSTFNLGTYFYPPTMQWNRLDRFFVTKSFYEKHYVVETYKIVNDDFITGSFEYSRKGEALFGSRVVGIPKKYSVKAKSEKKRGFSDHFPIVFSFKIE